MLRGGAEAIGHGVVQPALLVDILGVTNWLQWQVMDPWSDPIQIRFNSQ